MKYIYDFEEGNKDMKALLGGKGANLAEMTGMGIPVPPGFTITTEACIYYSEHDGYPEGLPEETARHMEALERKMGKKFGDPEDPLLVSVRSGARASMPGMMDTILNLGLNDLSVRGLAEKTGNPRFAYDSYRRFIAMYGDVVLELKPEGKEERDPFDEILDQKKAEAGVRHDNELPAEDLRDLAERFKAVIKERKGVEFPQDPRRQLDGAIIAVFKSWDNERAIAYRRMYDIPDKWGTAVNVQSMVFGNTGETSATGVGFTRNPATGENRMYGEYLLNAQGEDVVAGIRTPLDIERMKASLPESYEELVRIRDTLDRHFRDMQDFEFTIEDRKLWMLQTRTGKRTGFAAVRIALDMVDEGLITPEEAVSRVDPEGLNDLLRPVFDIAGKEKAEREGVMVATGTPAGPGAATGRVVLFAADAHEQKAADPNVQLLLVRHETSPEDIKGMAAAEGFLTQFGGATSHAALVARQMGKVCVVGCAALDIDYDRRVVRIRRDSEVIEVKEGDWLSIDGTSGKVYLGRIETSPPEIDQVLITRTMKAKDSPVFQDYDRLMKWADRIRKLKVRANADTPGQSEQAIAFGAEGIGLCRTEHMFFGGDRILAVRQMILARDEAGRREALEKLFPMQKEDFTGIFRVMGKRPVTIRLLDPPLHEFLPHGTVEIEEVAGACEITPDEVEERCRSLAEVNPMMGHRGCRLGLTFPEIYEMQVRAIVQAACEVAREGVAVKPEIMIPLVGSRREMAMTRELTVRTADATMAAEGSDITYMVGTMVELPRACIVADLIAENAEFFSFGTNDLTQTAFGISRDDVKGFLPTYMELDIYPNDPFQRLDPFGVRDLMKLAVKRGRSTRKKIKLGICGEHGGDPSSVKICHGIGLDYVSCSPYRVPIARLAAAQAALEQKWRSDRWKDLPPREKTDW
ncbi:MAG: pyruvate, phosphate dikinase [Actinobacteria bacterium]|nr:pyruvate, phosphate dikinase [Actinomycetota bacterium]MBU1943702.1 pyruvate, phosphate dikinase [Actinomycetota bacterium]MBU2686154.1 pyruvate, phosphate dikinase [Actinomycetota bacterium]